MQVRLANASSTSVADGIGESLLYTNTHSHTHAEKSSTGSDKMAIFASVYLGSFHAVFSGIYRSKFNNI